ncbi:GGDEF domain-containing protein [Pigmentiphaga sp.]|uniref:GGDEF domain-containing protein n=1 Tax=Pigmentiphaga sp. TaxID=1977564 RepID=UPI00128E564B|nr:GGDEF domain-containing protein [Pigmentiphaga sp.]MPS27745.1 GGDEF domain-containing protein [Alcaligenaceae bacterium SAGV5]MPS50855.1 GGDEF domain-containing protein [Alcaligenaceae bacterium SAGV3]MPT59595.1 GGDEF domain-containing protein [Alcaligenaceae bacterium]
MSVEFVIGVLNTSMSAIFGASLLALWYYQRELGYIAILVFSYAVRILSFGSLYAAFALDMLELRMVANALILAATALLSVAISKRLRLRPHYGSLAAITAISLAGGCFFVFVEDNLPIRAAVINLGLAAICFVMLADLTRRHRRTPVEQLLLGQIAIAFLSFVSRPLTFLIPGIDPAQSEAVYWIVVSISDTLICSTLAAAIFAVIAVDVMDRFKAEAQIDMLSGLFNRRGFESRALPMLARQTGAAPAALILTDLDHFKSINDRFGHLDGDKVIRTFSDILKDKAPRDAIVGRIGGEEFAILLPPGLAAAAHAMADTARSAFKATAPAIFAHAFHPTASFGIAIARAGDNLLGLMERADHALYRAKNEGRDCVR